jgi:hypothetical protein
MERKRPAGSRSRSGAEAPSPPGPPLPAERGKGGDVRPLSGARSAPAGSPELARTKVVCWATQKEELRCRSVQGADRSGWSRTDASTTGSRITAAVGTDGSSWRTGSRSGSRRDQSAHRQATPGANIAGRDRTRMRCLGAVAADRCKPPLRERGPARRGGGGKRWVLRCCSATNCGASWGASETFRGSRAWFATLSLHEAPEPHWCPLVLRPPRQLVLARSGLPDYPESPRDTECAWIGAVAGD